MRSRCSRQSLRRSGRWSRLARLRRSLAARPPRARSSAGAVAGREHSLGLHRIVSAVAPRVAPEQAPRREHRAPKYAVLPDRFDRIARARRLVLAAPRDRRRDEALVATIGATSRRARATRAGASTSVPRPGSRAARLCARRSPARSSAQRRLRRLRVAQPRLRNQLAERSFAPASPSRSTSSAADGRATTTTSWPARSSSSARANASRSIRLTRLRSTAPPTLRDTDSPRRGRSADGVRERVEHQVAVRRRAALAVDALELRAARQAAAAGRRAASSHVNPHASGGESLAPLVAAALERQPAGARAHAGAEPVRTGALALLRLVGALHRLFAARCPTPPRPRARGRDARRAIGAASIGTAMRPRRNFPASCGSRRSARRTLVIVARTGARGPSFE